MSPVDHPTYQPVSRAKDAVVHINVPGPEGAYTIEVTPDGYEAADASEEAALEASPLVQHKATKEKEG